MPNWFKNKKEEELPERLRGKSPEEVAKALEEAEAAKERLSALEADRSKEKEQVAALSNQFNDVKAKLAATEANLNKLQNPPRTEEPADWLTEPEKAVDQRMAPLTALTVQSAKMTARILAQQSLDNEDSVSPADARTMNGRLFRAWESEINTEAEKYPATSMLQPQTWIGLFYLVKGRHADELANVETRKKKYNFLESASNNNPPPPQKEKTGVEALTDQELHVAAKMKITPEAYAKRKKEMTFVNA